MIKILSFIKRNIHQRFFKDGHAPKITFIIGSIIPTILVTVLFAVINAYSDAFTKTQSKIMTLILITAYVLPILKLLHFKALRHILAAIFLLASPFLMFYCVELFTEIDLGDTFAV